MAAKAYNELTFADDFMFGKVLGHNLDLCKELLELILNIKIRKIVDVTKQKSIDIAADAKSVRLDVYVEDTEESVYDVEMQTTVRKELPKRSRYYQGMIDLNLIEKGENYKDLKKSYVIFICLEDLFGRNLPVYTFENICKEAPDLLLGDETSKVFVNAEGQTLNLSDEMKDFLRYLKEGSATEGTLAARIDEAVNEAREHLEWRNEYMTLQMRFQEIAEEAREEAIKEGRAKGLEEGRAKGLEEGRAKGLEEGRETKLAEVIAEMLQDNIPIPTIAKYCKESEEEIRGLIKKMNIV